MRRLLLIIVVLAAFTAVAQDKKLGGLTPLGTKTEEISGLSVPAPGQRCENWAWMAAVQAMMSAQGVTYTQDALADKSYGGTMCVDTLPSLEQISLWLDGDYQLDNGTKFTLKTVRVTGAPTTIDDLIVNLRQQRPMLLVWKNHAYVLEGMVYNEFLHPTGSHRFEVQELRLVDPLAPEDADSRHVTFTRADDDPNDIQGMLWLEIEPKITR
jgi:hypothetical protein